MPSATANRMELFVRKSFLKAMRTREKNDSYERRLNKSMEELNLKYETRTKSLNNEIRQLGVNLKKSGVKDVKASVSLPSTAPSSRSSTPDAAARSTTTSLPATMTSLPLLDAYRNRNRNSSAGSYHHRSASENPRASRSTALGSGIAWGSRNTATINSQSGRDTVFTNENTSTSTRGTRSTFSKYSDKSIPKSSTTFRSSLRKSPKRSANSRVSFESHHCLVAEDTKGDCHHFPCLLPSSYNHVGYASEEEEKMTTRPVSMSASTQRRMFRALDAKSARRPQRSTMANKTKLREDGLHKLVHHMRWKNELTKPPEWVLNYGKPTPLRKILKPARATALEV